MKALNEKIQEMMSKPLKKQVRFMDAEEIEQSKQELNGEIRANVEAINSL